MNDEKITIKEMLEHLDKIERGVIHDFLCICFQCEKKLEELSKSITIRLDLQEILN